MDLFTINSLDCSEITTKNYSTSFSYGVRLLGKSFRRPIYAIYGFVRFADEIVDTFHDQDKKELIRRFEEETFDAIESKFSINPILHSFQWAVNEYGIEHDMIRTFLRSMKMDLYANGKIFNKETYNQYIYGSAEVVGLMCLKIFTFNNNNYDELAPPARKLGEAFQKVNFLRDISADMAERDRFYFPEINFDKFDDQAKKIIEQEIQSDFAMAYPGILKLDMEARLGVYVAFTYYQVLFNKIKNTSAKNFLEKRFRISNFRKIMLIIKCFFKIKLGLI